MFIFTRFKKSLAVVILIIFTATLLCLLPGAGTESKETQKGIDLPIIMYHSLLKDKKLQNDYTISPTIFEEDLKYITQNGYTTITVSELVSYVYQGKALPQKCIMLTFDDGYYNNYYYAFPLLKKYKCKAVISPIVSVTEKFTQSEDISVTYGYVSVDNLREMVESGFVEIQNHSYDMHSLAPRRGVEQKSNEIDDDYKTTVISDISRAQDYLIKNVGIKPDCFVYPFGAKSKNTLEIIREMGFVCTMTCTEKNNVITKDPESIFELGRYRRRPDKSLKDMLAAV